MQPRVSYERLSGSPSTSTAGWPWRGVSWGGRWLPQRAGPGLCLWWPMAAYEPREPLLSMRGNTHHQHHTPRLWSCSTCTKPGLSGHTGAQWRARERPFRSKGFCFRVETGMMQGPARGLVHGGEKETGRERADL